MRVDPQCAEFWENVVQDAYGLTQGGVSCFPVQCFFAELTLTKSMIPIAIYRSSTVRDRFAVGWAFFSFCEHATPVWSACYPLPFTVQVYDAEGCIPHWYVITNPPGDLVLRPGDVAYIMGPRARSAKKEPQVHTGC